MKTVTILLLLIVQVLGRNPYPDHIKTKFTHDPSIPMSRQVGTTTIVNSYDNNVLRVVFNILDDLNLYIMEHGGNNGQILQIENIGKVNLTVVDEHQRLPHERYRFIKNIYTFDKLMFLSTDGHYGIDVYGSVSLIYNEAAVFVKNYSFINAVVRNAPIPVKESIRRKSIPGDINDKKKN